ncbi:MULTISPECIES: hypothetical protein [unclassified Nocardioides]|uniref:hypothetical protein n=1 Tax=unclassified Nocardioides TaxID=2615069 RepID=UPI0009EFD46A|nr:MULTISPECIES: hypothetical protein [unclassified Nocardioides]GAW48755.1 hypothetical protein PD653B2_1070 [Nocardioides sp. PD653-B2]GAW54392.1 hypothetical protein PD653_1800 [Nocardioides sp. PD653]
MLTDDDLTRQLGSAFREEAGDLEYAGRVPTLRRTGAVALPIAATAAVAGVLVAVAATNADDPVGPGTTIAGPSSGTGTSPGAAATPRLVTDTIEIAGYTYTYQHAVGEQLADDLYAVMNPGEVPADARPLDAPAPARAWVGTDPTSGDTALWVEAPTRNGGHLFALLSPTWTTDQLADLFHHGEPRQVPAITR